MNFVEPHTRRGLLRHGNPSGDFTASPRCGARTRRHTPCLAPGVRLPDGEYTRCRMHGGAAARANWKTGRYSLLSERQRHELAEMLGQAHELTAAVWAEIEANAGLPPHS